MEIRQTPVGSLPRSKQLQDAYAAFNKEELGRGELDQVIESEIKDVVSEYEKIENNPLITTGEVEKPNFLTYFLDNGFIKLGDPSPEDAEGFVIDFEGHHSREIAVLQKEQTPFSYAHYGDEWISTLKKFSNKPFKATVIAPSAVSLIYQKDLPDYSKEKFISDVINECVKDIKKCINAGAAEVGMDMTEATYALKVDPTGAVLREMVDLINRVADQLTENELNLITLHTCFGADNFTNHNYSNYQDVYPALLH